VAASWEAFYKSDAQGLYALVVGPIAFLVWLAARGWWRGAGLEPTVAPFVRGWAIVFAAVALLDPIATGPLGWPLLPFVLLGDYRVLAFVLVVMEPGRARGVALAEAAAWTLVVPVSAFAIDRALTAISGPHPEAVLWLVYELGFLALASVLVFHLLPRRVGIARVAVRRMLRRVLGVVVLYYGLWAVADVLILAGRDWAWGLRILPNLLYYGAFVPAAYLLFFRSPSAASSRSTQAAR